MGAAAGSWAGKDAVRLVDARLKPGVGLRIVGPWTTRERFEDIVDAICAWHEEARASKVFSMPCVKRSGKVVFGLSRTGMVFKLTDPDVHRRALALPGAHLFDPSGTRRGVSPVGGGAAGAGR